MTKINRRSPRSAGILVGLVALAAAAVIAVSGCGSSSGGTADLPTGVVARVYDTAITQQQLDQTIARAQAQAKQSGQTLPSKGETGYDQVERQALQQLIQQVVVNNEARKCGPPCEVTPKDIDAELARIRTTNFQGSQKKFDAFLKKSAITPAAAREIVLNQLQQQKLLNHVTRGIRFTPAEAKAYYDQNKSQFTVAAGRTARHILVPTKAEADRIRAEVTLQNFGELAKKYSTDTGSAQQGGSLGQIQKGPLVPEFEKVAFALKSGQISQPVKTQFGWHIITVTVTPAKTTSFAEAEKQIIQSQLAAKRQVAWNAWGQSALKNAEAHTVYADAKLKPSTTSTAATTATAPASTPAP